MRIKLITGMVAFSIVSYLFQPVVAYASEEKIDELVVKQEVYVLTEKYDLDYSIIMGQIKLESHFDNGVVSSAGAFGIMQLMESTAKWMYDEMIKSGELTSDMAYNPKDWEQNLQLGIYHMKWLLDRYCDGNRDTVSYKKALGYYWMGICAYPKYVKENGIDTKYSRIVLDYAKEYENDIITTSRGGTPGRLKEFENGISIEGSQIDNSVKGDGNEIQNEEGRICLQDDGRPQEIEGTEKAEGDSHTEEGGAGPLSVYEGTVVEEEKEGPKALVYVRNALLILGGIIVLLHTRRYLICRIKRARRKKKRVITVKTR